MASIESHHPTAAVVEAKKSPDSSPFFQFQYYRKRKHHLSGCPKPETSSSLAISKKTRDLPKLNECHGCQFRIDAGNGRDRLRTLYSEWRIVLLCKRCFSLVESSQICSYCFSEISDKDEEKDQVCFRCCSCSRCVHQSCFIEYKSVAPWSFSCSRSNFSVCIDCWVPKSLACLRLNNKSCKKRKFMPELDDSMDSKNGLDLGDSRGSKKVTAMQNSSMVLVLESVLKNVNCAAKKKVEEAVKVREMALRKAVVARRAVKLDNSAIDLDENKDEENGFSCKKVVDDAELAFQLHRAMNSSPRITKNLCPPSLSSCFAVPRRTPERNVDSSISVCGKLKVFTTNENPDESVSEPSVGLGGLHHDASSLDIKCMELGRNVEIRFSSNDGECRGKLNAEDEKADMLLKEGEGSCSNKLNSCGDDNCSIHSESRLCREQEEYTVLKEGRYKPVSCLIQYKRKRDKSSKVSPNYKPELLHEGFGLDNLASDAGLSL